MEFIYKCVKKDFDVWLTVHLVQCRLMTNSMSLVYIPLLSKCCSYKLLNMFRATWSPSSGADDYRCNTLVPCCVGSQVQLAASVSFRRFVVVLQVQLAASVSFRRFVVVLQVQLAASVSFRRFVVVLQVQLTASVFFRRFVVVLQVQLA